MPLRVGIWLAEESINENTKIFKGGGGVGLASFNKDILLRLTGTKILYPLIIFSVPINPILEIL